MAPLYVPKFGETPSVSMNVFADIYNLRGQNSFITAIKYFTENKISIEGTFRIFSIFGVLMADNKEIQELITKLSELGIHLHTKPEGNEIEGKVLTAESFRSKDWITVVAPDGGRRFLVRRLYIGLRNGIDSEVYESLKEIDLDTIFTIKYFRDVIDYAKTNIERRKHIHDILVNQILKLQEIPCNLFFDWAMFLLGNQEPILYKEFINASILPGKATLDQPETEWTHFKGRLNANRVTRYLESQKWENVSKCMDFLQVIGEATNQSPTMTGWCLTYFSKEIEFAGTVEFVKAFEFATKRELSPVDFFYLLLNAVVQWNPSGIRSLVEFISLRNILDDRHWKLILRGSIEQEDSEVLKFVLENSSMALPQFDAERQRLIEDLVLENNWISLGRVFRFMNENSLYDEHDLVLVVRNLSSPDLGKAESLIDELLESNYKISGILVAHLCNRYSRITRYSDILRIIKKYESKNVIGNPIVQLYACLAHANQGENEAAKEVIRKLLAQGERTLIAKYAPGIVSKIQDLDVVAMAEALNFEFQEVVPSMKIERSMVISSSGLQRNRVLPKQVKAMYQDVCQVCDIPLESPLGRISEAAHIQGLGSPHYGSDDLSNLLCLCPNHHSQFDNAGWYISDEFDVIEVISGLTLGVIKRNPEHAISQSAIKYQREYALNAAHRKTRIWNAQSLTE